MKTAGRLAICGCIGLALLVAPAEHARAAAPDSGEQLAVAPLGFMESGAAGLFASSAHAGARQPAPVPQTRRIPIRRMRPNTVSVGIQGGYGIVRGSSRISDGFDGGPGYAFRFRYMLRPSFALGFSFEHHYLHDREIPTADPSPDIADSHVVMTTVAGEGVFYFNREREAHPYIVAGFGYASPDIVYTPVFDVLVEETKRTNEGPFLVAGAGFERFIRDRYSFDIAARVYGLVSDSELTSFLQVTAGIHLYPGD